MIKNNIITYIIDTSSILSGKYLIFQDCNIVTTPGVSDELKPGGKDYQKFEIMKEGGLKIFSPDKKYIRKIKEKSKDTGDIGRISDTDVEILALALELKNKGEEVVILTDDYSIQNMANNLSINYENISQKKIKKRFKWVFKCRGCGKKFKDNINKCPICGSETKKVIVEKNDLVN